MDLRAIFKEISDQLLSEFRKTSQVSHHGGRGALREDAFADFLKDYLPSRYAVGRGEIISAANAISGQIDLVIYDQSHCPVLIKSTSLAVFPIESVFGVVSIKSTLSSSELQDAYKNVGSAKRLVDPSSFTQYPVAGMAIGVGPPRPVGVVFAYAADRSLEAISAQVKLLDAQLGADVILRPDFIVVLEKGIVGPRGQLRSDFNDYQLPTDGDHLAEIRKTGRHTLLRAYLQILSEINSIILRDLNIHDYLRMPSRVGGFLVSNSRHVRQQIGSDPFRGSVKRLSEIGIRKIVSFCQKTGSISLRQHYLNAYGAIPAGLSDDQLLEQVFEYNPRGLPRVEKSKLILDEKNRVLTTDGGFLPYPLTIDGASYAVDMSSLDGDVTPPEKVDSREEASLLLRGVHDGKAEDEATILG